MIVVVHRILIADSPVVGQVVITVSIVVSTAQGHDLFGLTRSQSPSYGAGPAAAKILGAYAQGVGDWVVAEVTGMQFDVTTLVDRIDADPIVLAAG